MSVMIAVAIMVLLAGSRWVREKRFRAEMSRRSAAYAENATGWACLERYEIGMADLYDSWVSEDTKSFATLKEQDKYEEEAPPPVVIQRLVLIRGEIPRPERFNTRRRDEQIRAIKQRIENNRGSAHGSHGRVAYYATLRRKYEYAARHPRLRVAPDQPPPN